MQRIIICLLALVFSTAVSAQTGKYKKSKKTETEKADSTAVKKDDESQLQDTAKKVTKKKDYKKANENAKKKTTGTGTSTGKPGTKNGKTTTTKKTTPVKQKPMTTAEKKKAEQEEAEREANTPKGVEAYFYQFPKEYLPVVIEFMAVKQQQSPHLKVVDDNILRKQIIRYKNVDKGYIMLQKPGDTKYTKLQVFKKANGTIVMAVEQSDCIGGVCKGSLNFYVGSAGGWKDATDEFYPQIDSKFVISRLKTKYKKEYKDLELYNEKAYEDNEANLKKAITYTIVPDEAKISIQEQYLPCTLYEMVWDGKKDKFDLKKIEK
jgi:hypothetical protein